MIDRQTLSQDEKDFIGSPMQEQNLMIIRKLKELDLKMDKILATVGNPVVQNYEDDPDLLLLQQQVNAEIKTKQKNELESTLVTLRQENQQYVDPRAVIFDTPNTSDTIPAETL